MGDTNYDFIDIVSGGWSNYPLMKAVKSKVLHTENKNNVTEKLYWQEGSWIYKLK